MQIIIKFKMIILLDSLGDYMILTLKNSYIKKSDHGTINKLKYIILAQTVVVVHNMTHLVAWSINLVLLQI
jgi:hypothetical protein